MFLFLFFSSLAELLQVHPIEWDLGACEHPSEKTEPKRLEPKWLRVPMSGTEAGDTEYIAKSILEVRL